MARRLADIDAINLVPSHRDLNKAQLNAIDFRTVFTNPETVFFHLSMGSGVEGATEIGRMALFSLINASISVGARRDKLQTYLIIDEFQLLAAPNLKAIFQLARGFNVGLIVANQSALDLKLSDGTDVKDVVKINTRLKQFHSFTTEQEIDEVIKLSGETVELHRSITRTVSDNGESLSTNDSPVMRERFSVNDLVRQTDSQHRNVLQVRQGEGFLQLGGMPVMIDSPYTVSPEMFHDAERAPWPVQSFETMPAGYRMSRKHTGTPKTYQDIDFDRRNPPQDINSNLGPDLTPKPPPQNGGPRSIDELFGDDTPLS